MTEIKVNYFKLEKTKLSCWKSSYHHMLPNHSYKIKEAQQETTRLLYMTGSRLSLYDVLVS